MAHCMRHYEEPVLDHCKACGRPFCNRCLVFPFGEDKPPYCVGCALTASGVRNGGMKTIVAAEPRERTSWADKAKARSTKRALKRAAKKSAQPILGDDGPRPTTVPAPDKISTPSSRFSRKAKVDAEATPVD